MIKYRVFVILTIFYMLMLVLPGYTMRVRDMGLGVSDNAWLTDGTETYIYDNPAYLYNFTNRVFFERIGVNNGDNMGGIIFNPFLDLHIGIFTGLPINNDLWNSTKKDGFYYIDDYETKANFKPTLTDPSLGANRKQLDLIDPDGNASTTANSPAIRNRMDQQDINLMLAYDFGRWGLGVMFVYTTSNIEKQYDNNTTGYHDEYYFFNAEYDLAASSFVKINETMTIDIAAEWIYYDFHNHYKGWIPGAKKVTSYRADGPMDINATVRFNLSISQVNRMHFNAGYSFLNRSTQANDKDFISAVNVFSAEKFTRYGQIVSLGISDEMRFSNYIMAYIGAQVNFKMFNYKFTGTDDSNVAKNSDKYKMDTTSFEVPVFVGIEANLSRYFTARLGVSHIAYNPISEKGEKVKNSIVSPEKINVKSKDDQNSDTSLNFGVSIKYGNISIDWLANMDLLLRGPDFISGNSTSQSISGNDGSTPISMALGITYNFDSLVQSINVKKK